MSSNVKTIFRAAEILFLAGIALLIIRNNDYSWPIKRASDILFLLAFILIFFFAILSGEWRKILKYKNVLVALLAILIGMIIASWSNYLIVGTPIDADGVLEFGRFVEAVMILLTAGFLSLQNRDFVKKAAFAQFSTLIYIFVLLAPNNLPGSMGRFQLFENWPSNVGYYLIVSLSLLFILLLKSIRPFKKTFFVLYILTIGLTSILIWTQSRASWLAWTIVALGILIFVAFKQFGRIQFVFKGLFILFSILFLAYALLPATIKTEALLRFFPQYRVEINRAATNIAPGIKDADTQSLQLAQRLIQNNPQVNLFDPGRIYLWKEYVKRFLRQPLGLGVNPTDIIYEGSKRGPHNTILEIIEFSGIIGLVAFIYLYYFCFRNLLSSHKRDHEQKWSPYLVASLTALIIASFFDGMSTFRLMWILLGLGIFMNRDQFIARDKLVTRQE